MLKFASNYSLIIARVCAFISVKRRYQFLVCSLLLLCEASRAKMNANYSALAHCQFLECIVEKIKMQITEAEQVCFATNAQLYRAKLLHFLAVFCSFTGSRRAQPGAANNLRRFACERAFQSTRLHFCVCAHGAAASRGMYFQPKILFCSLLSLLGAH